MKKLITLALLGTVLLSSAAAQRANHVIIKTGNPLAANMPVAKGTGQVSGVVYPASFASGSACASSIYTYRDSTSGYFAGINAYGDKELLMRYTLADYSAALPATVDTVMAFFGAKYVGGNSMVYAKVYTADASGAPGTLLGTSAGVSVSAIDTSGGITAFTFASPVALTTNKFFVSIDVSALYATGDTVGLFSTDDACSTTDPTGAWTKVADNSFYAFSDANNNWGFPMDMAIFAKITANALGINDITGNTFSATAYPSPASGQLILSFTGQDNGTTNATIKDITGKTVCATSLATVKGNTYKVPFDVSILSNGFYVIGLSSGASSSTLKVSIQH